jgi:hypothetical protein
VLVDELRVEQLEAAPPEPRDKMDERNLARVRRRGEHALAEKSRAEGNAVDAADKPALLPCLDAMGVALRVQRGIERDDFVVDPGIGPRVGAAAHHAFKRAVESDGVRPAADGPAQLFRHMQPGDGQDAALLGVVPVDLGAIAPRRHGENPRAVGLQHDIGGDSRHSP